MKRYFFLILIVSYMLVTILSLRNSYVLLNKNIFKFSECNIHFEYLINFPKFQFDAYKKIEFSGCALEFLKDHEDKSYFIINLCNVSKEKVYLDPQYLLSQNFIRKMISFLNDSNETLVLPILDSDHLGAIKFPIMLSPKEKICFPILL